VLALLARFASSHGISMRPFASLVN
jgi:hypothetical protein